MNTDNFCVLMRLYEYRDMLHNFTQYAVNTDKYVKYKSTLNDIICLNLLYDILRAWDISV